MAIGRILSVFVLGTNGSRLHVTLHYYFENGGGSFLEIRFYLAVLNGCLRAVVYAVSREMLLSKKAREIAQATTVITTHALHHGKRAITNSVRYLQ
jgi:hypothetical protein